jgi:ArsR family metal-binding transcriptional regulator
MTRAVVKLSSDISSAMPRVSKLIEGCAYNPEANLLAFRFKHMVVNMESRLINISHIEDENEINPLVDWLVSLINGTNKK